MKKVTCLVMYTKLQKYYVLDQIFVKHKNENIILYNAILEKIDKQYQYKYLTFNDLYKDVLSFLKSNNMYVNSWVDFNSKWYNIDFLNTYNYEINRYSLKE